MSRLTLCLTCAIAFVCAFECRLRLPALAGTDDTAAIRKYAETTGAKVNDYIDGKLRVFMLDSTTDADLVSLANLASLRLGTLDLSSCDKITDAGFLTLATLPGLEQIELPPQLSDAAYANFSDRFPIVNTVRIRAVSRGIPVLTNDTLGSVSRLYFLAELTAPTTVADDECWKSLASASGLRLLTIGSPKLTGVGVRGLARREKLEALIVANSPLSEAGVAEIAELGSVVRLHLTNCGITDQGVAALTALPRLSTLNLAKNPITDNAIASARIMPKLSSLDIFRTSVGDAGLMSLAGMTGLREVHVVRAKVTDRGAENFSKASPSTRVRK